MTIGLNKNKDDLTVEGELIVALSRALFVHDVEKAFDLIGKFMDENNLQISNELIDQYRSKGRIAQRKILNFPGTE